MRRAVAACIVLLSASVGWVSASEQVSAYGIRFYQTRDNKVVITSVDAKGLASQMGLRRDDVIVQVGVTPINSNAALVKAFQTLGPRNNVKYHIKVDRMDMKSKVRSQVDVKGTIRSSPKKPGTFFAVREK
jgi:S1-C subfamily serine protease